MKLIAQSTNFNNQIFYKTYALLFTFDSYFIYLNYLK